MVNFGNGVFDFTSNVSGTANVVSGESTGAIWQNAPIDELRKQMSLIITQSGVSAPYSIPASYFVFKASGGYFARSMISGYIQFSDSNSVDPVMNNAINTMTSGMVQDPSFNVWSGSPGGLIAVGPGIFNVKSAIILKSRITINGAGRDSTIFQWQSGLVLDNVNQIMMKSNSWERLNASASGGTSAGSGFVLIPTMYGGEDQVALTNFAIDGNRNTISGQLISANVSSAAGQSGTYGHGIAYYGMKLFIDNVIVRYCIGAGIINMWVSNDTSLASNQPFPLELADLPEHLIFRTRAITNGLQGFMVRAASRIRDVWAFGNGEAGLEQQTSAIYGSYLDLRDWNFFGNATNYTSYDPRAYSVKFGGAGHADGGLDSGTKNGDGIRFGGSGYAAVAGASGYIPVTTSTIIANNLTVGSNHATLVVAAANNMIEAKQFGPQAPGGAQSGAVMCKILASDNTIFLTSMFNNVSGAIICQLGQDANDPYQYGPQSGAILRPGETIIRIDSFINQAVLQFTSGCPANNIQIRAVSRSGQVVIISGDICIDRTQNNVTVVGGSGLGYNSFTPLVTTSGITTTAPAAGGAQALPATPAGYIDVWISGKSAPNLIPFY